LNQRASLCLNELQAPLRRTYRLWISFVNFVFSSFNTLFSSFCTLNKRDWITYRLNN